MQDAILNGNPSTGGAVGLVHEAKSNALDGLLAHSVSLLGFSLVAVVGSRCQDAEIYLK